MAELMSNGGTVPDVVACHSCGVDVHCDHHVWECGTCDTDAAYCCLCDEADDVSCREGVEDDGR